jgi:hypothetical protein
MKNAAIVLALSSLLYSAATAADIEHRNLKELTGPCFKEGYVDLAVIRGEMMDRLAKLRVPGKPYGCYRLTTTKEADIYATCDAVHIRTIMGEDFQKTLTAEQRQQWIDYINSFAQPNGVYRGGRHADLHRNGMVIGALGPLGGKQKYPVSLYDEFDDADEVAGWLETKIDWKNFWGGSHLFWGGMHCYSNSRRCTPKWTETVLAWLDANLDPATGFWRKGVATAPHNGIGGGAHLWPIYQQHGHRFPYPERAIDSILKLQQPDGTWLGQPRAYYMDLDALYGLRFFTSQSPGYRKADVREAVRRNANVTMTNYYPYMQSDPDLHSVLGLVGCIGLLQQHDPATFRDTVRWTDIFSDARLYQTDKVEVLP